MIITIDGPAGSGKSSVATFLADRLRVAHLDTGAMYRAVALDALEHGVLDNEAGMAARAARLTLTFDWSKKPAAMFLDGRDVSELIRQPKVTEATYRAADNVRVRTILVQQQRQIAAAVGSLVTEGRDQGTVVFPDAEFKFYLDAAPEERARRRIKQLAERGIVKELDEILPQIIQRDARDKGRAVGPLVCPHGAIVLDTTPLSLIQVVAKMHEIVTAGGAGKGGQ